MSHPQTPLLAIPSSSFGQQSQPQHLKLCHLTLISVLEPRMVLIAQNLPEGQQSSLPFSLTPSQAGQCVSFPLPPQETPGGQPGKGKPFPEVGKLLANTAAL